MRSSLRQQTRVAWALISLSLMLGVWAGAPAVAQLPEWTLPDKFTLEAVAAGLASPTGFAFLPDGSILITEQAGFVKRFRPDQARVETILDLSHEVNGLLERGLTGLAVDPAFNSNGYVYLLYTYDQPGEEPDGDGFRLGKLVRFTLRGGQGDPASAVTLLDGFESNVPYHAPGGVRAARDGALIVSFGDGSNPYDVSDLSLRSQDLNQLQGKLVRIDRTGKALSDNPFYDPAQPDSVRSKVWAYGFRNPFQFTLRPDSGLPYVGNVGWNTTESIVRASAGANFGWPCYESDRRVPEFATTAVCANLQPTSLTHSDYDYPHAGDNAAVIGGDFNIGEAFPPEMRGNYFFGDYSKRFIRRAELDREGRIAKVDEFAQGIGFPVDIQFGPDGALYFVDILGGQLERIRYSPERHQPVAQLSIHSGAAFSPSQDGGPIAQPGGALQGLAPFTVTLSAAASSDADNEPLTYLWDFEYSPDRVGTNVDKLRSTTEPTVTHTYARAGEYVARVTVVDGAGWSDSAVQRVLVRDTKPRVEINSHTSGETLIPGSQVTLSGRGFDTNGTLMPSSMLSWTVEWHDGLQRRLLAAGVGEASSFVMPAASPGQVPNRLDESARAVVTLQATDATGNAGVQRIRLVPQPRDGYIRTWWLIGGFPQKGLYDDVLPGGEARFVLSADGSGAQLIQSLSRKINLSNYIQPSDNNVAYAFMWIESPTARDALLGMNSDDGIAVWLNGQEVWRNKVARYVPDDTRDLDLPKVALKQGLNVLLVKVDQAFGEWAFKLRVLNPNGSVMRDVTVRTSPPTPTP